jgi:hypothetical protein
MSDQTQHLKICDAERYARRALKDARYWADHPTVSEALARAEHLLGEMREASYYLADPGCPENLKQKARERLEKAIINCN